MIQNVLKLEDTSPTSGLAHDEGELAVIHNSPESVYYSRISTKNPFYEKEFLAHKEILNNGLAIEPDDELQASFLKDSQGNFSSRSNVCLFKLTKVYLYNPTSDTTKFKELKDLEPTFGNIVTIISIEYASEQIALHTDDNKIHFYSFTTDQLSTPIVGTGGISSLIVGMGPRNIFFYIDGSNTKLCVYQMDDSVNRGCKDH